jgi:hypothetical protein
MDGHLAVREGRNPCASLEAANFAQVRHEAVVIVALSSGVDRRRAILARNSHAVAVAYAIEYRA